MITIQQLAEIYCMQKADKVGGSVYGKTQCEFAYNSNHMEGSKLTKDQTRLIFEDGIVEGVASVDDVLDAQNHFLAFDYILDHFENPLSESLLFDLHRLLKQGTKQARNPLYAIGGYKLYENEVGSQKTTSPENVASEMRSLLDEYETTATDFKKIVDFHARFESIHPFSDGNGRVGRLVMFKECLRYDVVPFIISDEKRAFYIRGLQNYEEEKGWLLDTCRDAQDVFEATMMPLAQSYFDAIQKISGSSF